MLPGEDTPTLKEPGVTKMQSSRAQDQGNDPVSWLSRCCHPFHDLQRTGEQFAGPLLFHLGAG
jgi:hypothetical protein